MKKVLILSLAAAFAFVPFTSANAQTTLTRSNISVVAPALIDVFQKMNVALSSIQAQRMQHNTQLQANASVLAGISADLSNNPNQSDAELNSKLATVQTVSNQVTSIANYRAQLSLALDQVANILGGMVSVLASAS